MACLLHYCHLTHTDDGKGQSTTTEVERSVCVVIQVKSVVAVAEPFRACEPLINAAELVDKIVIVERGDCMFVDKVTY